MPEPCPICGNPSNAGSPTFRGRKQVTCETCGQFQISDGGEAVLKRLSSEDRLATLEEARRRAGPSEIPYLGRTYFFSDHPNRATCTAAQIRHEAAVEPAHPVRIVLAFGRWL